jgi:hypothetical protein
MYVTRYYKNSSDEVLRIDTITFESTTNSLNKPITQKTYARKVSVELAIGALDRTVATIHLLTDANNYPFNVSGGNNYEWVSWDDPAFRCNMSDLPQIGETV